MINLSKTIDFIDGKPISTYTKLYGQYEKDGIIYSITNVYGGHYKYCDISIRIPREYLFMNHKFSESDSVPVSFYLLRDFAACVYAANESMQQSEAKVQKGFFLVYKTGQRVLPNTIVKIDDFVNINLSLKLPYNTSPTTGKTMLMSDAEIVNTMNSRKKGIISGRALKLLLLKNMPHLVDDFIKQLDMDELLEAVNLYNNQFFIRRFLKENKYVAFIANGAILPRKGRTDYKNTNSVKPFQSPKSMEIAICLPDGNTLSGMGIKEGITIITGDAYHGKSTVLDAIKEGIYNHVSGDGREYVITEESALSIYSEDGRSIKETDISFFLIDPPVRDINPVSFSTNNASGSTSQAAAVSEAIEMGCRLFLFDEDRCATNFMYKDQKIRAILKKSSTSPFLDNAQMFYQEYGISSIIVVGASSAFLDIADSVMLIDEFVAYAYTDYHKENDRYSRKWRISKRYMDISEFQRVCLDREIEIQDDTTIRLGTERIDISEILPHATKGQLSFICSFLYYLTVVESKNDLTIQEKIHALYKRISIHGMEIVRQLGFRGTRYMEFVEENVIMRILYRLRCIKFSQRRTM